MPIPANARDRIPGMGRTAAERRTSIRDALAAMPDGMVDPSTVTDAQIDAALAAVNVDELWDLERPTWKAEVWDRKSAINGVPADEVLVHHPEAQGGGDVAIIRDASGAVIMFQPYEPGQPGITPIPKGQGAQRGALLADDIVASIVSSELLKRVVERLTPATT